MVSLNRRMRSDVGLWTEFWNDERLRHDGGYGGYGYGAVHMIFWAVILIAIIVGVVWLVRSMTASGAHHHAAEAFGRP